MMKKLLSMLLAVCMLLTLTTAFAEETETPIVYVTISAGEILLPQCAVSVTDADGDGAVTILDAIYLAHEAAYEGGAAAGFGSAMGDFGAYLTMLWGIENGGSYGYYCNHAAAMNLQDAVQDGDYIDVYAYIDLETWSDTYSYFAERIVAEGEATLTLNVIELDENWMPVVMPLCGAEILANGEETGIFTDENGRATVQAHAGDVFSAKMEGMTLVPPCCVAESEA